MTIRVKMIGNNCRCWKDGEIFNVGEVEGYAYIRCHATAESTHYLLDSNDENLPVSEIDKCPEVIVLKD